MLVPDDSVAKLPSPTDTKIERGFKVVVVAGRNMPLKPLQRCNWFASGKSDPYIKVVCCGDGSVSEAETQTLQTQVCVQTLEPVSNETMTFGAPSDSCVLFVSCYNSETTRTHHLIGSVKIAIDVTNIHIQPQWYTLVNEKFPKHAAQVFLHICQIQPLSLPPVRTGILERHVQHVDSIVRGVSKTIMLAAPPGQPFRFTVQVLVGKSWSTRYTTL